MLAVGIAGDAAEEAANVVVDCRWCDNALPGPVPAPLDPRLTKPKPRFRAPIPVGKRHRHHMIRFLPRLLPWVREHLDAGRTVVIVDDDGEDRAPILLVALLSAFWTDDGARLSASGEGARARMEAHIAGLSKATFTQRYQWCVASNTKLFCLSRAPTGVFLVSCEPILFLASPSSCSRTKPVFPPKSIFDRVSRRWPRANVSRHNMKRLSLFFLSQRPPEGIWLE